MVKNEIYTWNFSRVYHVVKITSLEFAYRPIPPDIHMKNSRDFHMFSTSFVHWDFLIIFKIYLDFRVHQVELMYDVMCNNVTMETDMMKTSCASKAQRTWRRHHGATRVCRGPCRRPTIANLFHDHNKIQWAGSSPSAPFVSFHGSHTLGLLVDLWTHLIGPPSRLADMATLLRWLT